MSTFSKNPLQGLIDYVQEVKPYHTKLLDVFVQYQYSEKIQVSMVENLLIDVGLGFNEIIQPAFLPRPSTSFSGIEFKEQTTFNIDILDIRDSIMVSMTDLSDDISWDSYPWDQGGWNERNDPLIEVLTPPAPPTNECNLTPSFVFADRSPAITMLPLNVLAFDESTKRWMAAGSDFVLTSPDRVNWTQVNAPPPYNGTVVRPRCLGSNGNGVWIMGANPGSLSNALIYRSTDDGMTWTLVQVPSNGNMADIAYANGTWIIANASRVLRSVDEGLTWTEIFVSYTMLSIATDGMGNWTTNHISQAYSSDDGLTWTAGVRNIAGTIYAMKYDGSLWVGGGFNGQIITSTDGITWTEQQSATAGYPTIWSVAKYTAGWIVSGESGSYQLSADALSWNAPITLTTGRVVVADSRGDCLVAANDQIGAVKIWEAVNQTAPTGYTFNPLDWTILGGGVTTDPSGIHFPGGGINTAEIGAPTIPNPSANGVTTIRIQIDAGVPAGDPFNSFYQMSAWDASGAQVLNDHYGPYSALGSGIHDLILTPPRGDGLDEVVKLEFGQNFNYFGFSIIDIF